MRWSSRLTSGVPWVAALILTLVLPFLLPGGYAINSMINAMMWVIFALSFDLSAGHVGTVSLGHPAFFGIGAYLTALLAPKLGLGFMGATLLSALAMAGLALAAGVVFFRIKEVSFAIGTLGAVIIAQLIANNAYDLTRGPMCVQGVARPEFTLPFSGQVVRFLLPASYYYLLIPLLIVTLVTYRALTSSRIGRAFAAVREDEVRSSAVGIHPLRYKLLAFSVGGGLIGALGSFQAQYITVVCPSELALSYTLNLLIIVFVGGAGSLRGVVLGAIIFSVLPRVLEQGGARSIPAAYQQVVYGLILVLVVIFFPEGFDGLLRRAGNFWRNRRGRQYEASDV
jgi:ABC-type branched-subunit amino acid transport system permease subunit